jgi:hypothetical protein
MQGLETTQLIGEYAMTRDDGNAFRSNALTWGQSMWRRERLGFKDIYGA